MTAALIQSNVSYLLLTFLPPLLWLLFYLREDRHPEPKLMLILAFIGGVVSAVLALAAECAWIFIVSGSCGGGSPPMVDPRLLFLGIAFIEEYVKYLPVKFLILNRRDFDEPVDAMVYMMTAALGFASLENALFSFQFFYQMAENAILALPLAPDTLWASLDVATNRFLGANLLHALSSGIVGFFLARAWFHPHRRHFLALGITMAALLHTFFNYLILKREVLTEGPFYIILLLAVMAVMVFIDFERLKRSKAEIPHV